MFQIHLSKKINKKDRQLSVFCFIKCYELISYIIILFNTQEGTNVVAVVLKVVADATSVHINETRLISMVLARTPEVVNSNQRATIRKS